MKTVLFAVLALTASTVAFSASENYKQKTINDDGSISIIGPRFSNAKKSSESDYYISINSKLDGVCKLYGQGDSISYSEELSYLGTGLNVEINRSGKYAAISANSITYVLDSIACENSDVSLKEKSKNYASASKNDDGTTTILNPMFRMSGNDLLIGVSSNLTGVCRLYGFNKNVRHSDQMAYSPSGKSVLITKKGKFERYIPSTNDYVIDSLICE